MHSILFEIHKLNSELILKTTTKTHAQTRSENIIINLYAQSRVARHENDAAGRVGLGGERGAWGSRALCEPTTVAMCSPIGYLYSTARETRDRETANYCLAATAARVRSRVAESRSRNARALAVAFELCCSACLCVYTYSRNTCAVAVAAGCC